jgi:FkbM family methyltransferase
MLRVGSMVRLALLRSENAYRLARRGYLVARYLARRPHERDFAAFAALRARDGAFLDVGANAGQSALSFRLFNKRAPILSIEANPYHDRDLRFVKRFVRGFDYRIVAAGEADGSLTLHVPTYRGIPITGEASVHRATAARSWWMEEHLDEADHDRFEIAEREVPVRRLDDLAPRAAFIKIDVEGYELPVLRGLAGTFARDRPVLMVERNGRTGEVVAHMRALGYRPFAFDARVEAFEPYAAQAARNLFFFPAEPAGVAPPAAEAHSGA